MKAVIVAGGKGTRILGITKNIIPKPMIKINDKPILEYQLGVFKANGITDIIIIVGHLGEQIEDYFKDGKSLGVSISYVREEFPLGTAGGLYFLKNKINEDFILVYGDLIFDVDFQKMLDFHKKNSSYITLLTHPNTHPYDSDLIVCDKNNKIIAIDRKDNKRNYYYSNLANAGIFIVSNELLKSFDILQKLDFEKDIVFKCICENKNMMSYRSTEYVKDCGNIDRFNSIKGDIDNNIPQIRNLKNKQKAIFLDRDGTINTFIPYLNNKNQFSLIDGVCDAIKRINQSEYLCIVVTNQPVIARGEATLEDVNEIHKKMETLLAESGCYVDDIYFCPHHPDKGFANEIKELKIDCSCRKPKIGMLLQAQEQYNIDLSKSIVVGDSDNDIQMAQNAQCHSVLLYDELKDKQKIHKSSPNLITKDLNTAINLILKK